MRDLLNSLPASTDGYWREIWLLALLCSLLVFRMRWEGKLPTQSGPPNCPWVPVDDHVGMRELEHKEGWAIDAFKLWSWRRLLRVPWTARRSNQSILKEISPEYSLEGLMLELKLQCLYLSFQGFYPAYSQFSFVFFMSILLQWINSSATILGLFVLKSSLFQRKCPMRGGVGEHQQL